MQDALRPLKVALAGQHGLLLVGAGAEVSVSAALTRALSRLLDARQVEAVRATFEAAGLAAPVAYGGAPLRAPHPTVSALAMWGASGRPGEVELAAHGVLLLSELSEWRSEAVEAVEHTLRSLRERDEAVSPLIVASTSWVLRHGTGEVTEGWVVEELRRRVSTRLAWVLDVRVPLQAVRDEAALEALGDFDVLEAVKRCWAVQRERWGRRAFNGWVAVADPVTDAAGATWGLDRDALVAVRGLLHAVLRQRVVRVARTLADLEGRRTVARCHVDEAVQLARDYDVTVEG